MSRVQDISRSLKMGELAAARDEATLRTLLGSCIGLVLYDARQRIGGLAHIVLPASGGRLDTPGKFVDTAIPALLSEMQALGDRPIRAEARIAGGANMFATATTNTVGRQNIDAVESLLREHRVPIVASHCGGEKGRRMKLETNTGVVTIEVVGSESIQL